MSESNSEVVGHVSAVRPVVVYDKGGRMTTLSSLREHDLLIIYWRIDMNDAVCCGGSSRSLMQFCKLDAGYLVGLCQSDSGNLIRRRYDLRVMDRIHVAGTDTGGWVMAFVQDLFNQKVKAEKANEKMRKNIDALKA
ncbi:MAG: hypothetical protein HYT62_00025 [Candidatus Yanofskybacteria bacterium]|nr:hypothetical protein [Candidatus Yanofskybacteria bacterium]